MYLVESWRQGFVWISSSLLGIYPLASLAASSLNISIHYWSSFPTWWHLISSINTIYPILSCWGSLPRIRIQEPPVKCDRKPQALARRTVDQTLARCPIDVRNQFPRRHLAAPQHLTGAHVVSGAATGRHQRMSRNCCAGQVTRVIWKWCRWLVGD